MNDTEALVFLTRAAMLDPRMKRIDPVDQADMAEAWSVVLDDVALDAALIILREHYREHSDSITPADVVAGVGAEAITSPYPQIHDGSKRAVLESFGTTPEEYDTNPVVRERVLAEFRQRELEAGS